MHGTTNGSLHKNYRVYMRFDEWKLWRRRWYKGYESATLYDDSTALNEARGWVWMIEWTLFRTTFGKGDGYIPLFNVRGFKRCLECGIALYARPLVGHACSLGDLFCDAFFFNRALTGRNRLLPGRVRLACQRLISGDSSPGNPPFPGITRLSERVILR